MAIIKKEESEKRQITRKWQKNRKPISTGKPGKNGNSKTLFFNEADMQQVKNITKNYVAWLLPEPTSIMRTNGRVVVSVNGNGNGHRSANDLVRERFLSHIDCMPDDGKSGKSRRQLYELAATLHAIGHSDVCRNLNTMTVEMYQALKSCNGHGFDLTSITGRLLSYGGVLKAQRILTKRNWSLLTVDDVSDGVANRTVANRAVANKVAQIHVLSSGVSRRISSRPLMDFVQDLQSDN